MYFGMQIMGEQVGRKMNQQSGRINPIASYLSYKEEILPMVMTLNVTCHNTQYLEKLFYLEDSNNALSVLRGFCETGRYR